MLAGLFFAGCGGELMAKLFRLREKHATAKHEPSAGAAGFIKVGCGKHREISPLIWVLTVWFLLRCAIVVGA
jgi:xanthine/uracil/vitamin C permease (AzgA family)